MVTVGAVAPCCPVGRGRCPGGLLLGSLGKAWLPELIDADLEAPSKGKVPFLHSIR